MFFCKMAWLLFGRSHVHTYFRLKSSYLIYIVEGRMTRKLGKVVRDNDRRLNHPAIPSSPFQVFGDTAKRDRGGDIFSPFIG